MDLTPGAGIPALPVREYAVKVAKEGFQEVAVQKVQIRKGEEALVDFKLVPMPKLAGLRLRGVVPGAQVFVGGNSLGVAYSDGTFQGSNIAPGEQTIELRRERYAPKQIRKVFRPGEILEVTGAELAMEVLPGRLRLNITPATGARIMIRRSDQAQAQPAKDANMDLPEGTYTITVTAPFHADQTVTVQLVAGETKNVPIVLPPLKAAAPPPPPKPVGGGMEGWEAPNAWVQDGPWMVRRGGGIITYKAQPAEGVFEFKVGRLKGRRLEWFVNFRDARNFHLFQLEKKTFYRKDVINGRTIDLTKTVVPALESESEYTLRVEISGTRIRHLVQRAGKWEVLDSWEEPGRNFTAGKFGFRIGGGDQVGLANFSFQPR